jgi:hypothetical protein
MSARWTYEDGTPVPLDHPVLLVQLRHQGEYLDDLRREAECATNETSRAAFLRLWAKQASVYAGRNAGQFWQPENSL